MFPEVPRCVQGNPDACSLAIISISIACVTQHCEVAAGTHTRRQPVSLHNRVLLVP